MSSFPSAWRGQGPAYDTFMLERADEPTPGVDWLDVWCTQHAYRIERALSLGGLLHWGHCRNSTGVSALGHRCDVAVHGHSSGGPAPRAATLLVDLSARRGSHAPAPRCQFSSSRGAPCGDALPSRQQCPSCRPRRPCPAIRDRGSASAREPPQHGCIHPTGGHRGDSRRLRRGSVAIPAHRLGQ